MSSFRTDRHRNPIACTTDLAKQAGLRLGVDYAQGDPFEAGGHTYYTAKFLGDPIDTSIRVIDACGYFTHAGGERWTYMAIQPKLYSSLTRGQKILAVLCHYRCENGTDMLSLFPPAML